MSFGSLTASRVGSFGGARSTATGPSSLRSPRAFRRPSELRGIPIRAALCDSNCMLGGRPACMAQYLSADLRIRVIGAVEAGMSRNAAARRFGVSIASAVRWMDEYLRTGRTAPKPRGSTGARVGSRRRPSCYYSGPGAQDIAPGPTTPSRLIAERGQSSFTLSTISTTSTVAAVHVQKKSPPHASEQAHRDVAERRRSLVRVPAQT